VTHDLTSENLIRGGPKGSMFASPWPKDRFFSINLTTHIKCRYVP